jgi:uncharacterized protein (DUF305 family)
MRIASSRLTALALILAACSGSGEAVTSGSSPSPEMMAGAARADSVRRHYTEADVAFMRDMIHHHAQALVMARMAPTHGASEELQTLAARIINGQKDEIALMQRWLQDRGEPVPHVDESGHTDMPPEHMASMAGMLSPQQMARLEAARGLEWDRYFLMYMIQHHQGALVMVDELFSSHGAGQGDRVFAIASGIGADQATEIDRMQRMLIARLN